MHFLTTFIYSEGFEATTPDHALASAVAVMLIGIVLVFFQMRLLGDGQRFLTIGGKAGRARMMGLGPWRWPIALTLAPISSSP